MQKLIKLSAVSMLAIVAASGANAAGYTCEELIEYTSCNSGYYLNAGKCIESTTCPSGSYLQPTCADGYELYHNLCEVDGEWSYGDDEEFCDGTFYAGWHCQDYDKTVAADMECQLCPSVGMTDKDGNAVTVKSDAGSIGIGACYIDPNAYFENEKGVYHYTSNCSAVRYGMTLDETVCNGIGGSWNNVEGACMILDGAGVIMSQSECERGDGTIWDSDTGLCFCSWNSEVLECINE